MAAWDRLRTVVSVVAIGLSIAGCSAVHLPFHLPTPAPTANPAQGVFDACETVQLPKVDATTFDTSAPDCVIVLWDAQMKEAVLTKGMRLLPSDLQTAAGAAGYTDTCEVGTNDRDLWLKHLPPADTATPPASGAAYPEWIATVWTRGAAQDLADALCALVISYL